MDILDGEMARPHAMGYGSTGTGTGERGRTRRTGPSIVAAGPGAAAIVAAPEETKGQLYRGGRRWKRLGSEWVVVFILSVGSRGARRGVTAWLLLLLAASAPSLPPRG